MEGIEDMSLEDEVKEFSILSRNSKITELLELCTQTKNKKELETIVSKFWKIADVLSSHKTFFCEFDICCLYAFDYVYEENSECLAAVSRAMYAYLEQNRLTLKDYNRNRFISCGNDCFVTGLRKVTNLESEEGMVIFEQSLMSSLMNGNVALAHFLAKFGFVDFASEANEESRKMIVELVNWLNTSYDYTIINMQEDMNTSIPVDELLNRLTESEISFRRCMLIFCTVCIVAEYGKYEKICMKEPPESGLSAFANRKKSECIRKMNCLHLYIDTTTEIKITFKDIETFTATVLNPQFSTEFGGTLVETSRKIMSKAHESYNPRLLKDLTRCKIRACVPNSMMLTKQVNQLTIPKILKQFLLFHSKEIWNFMIDNHDTLLSVQALVQHITDFGTRHNMCLIIKY